jgi:hypothetical protein
MSLFRYYISPAPNTPSPPLSELAEVFADNITSALEKIKREQPLPPHWPAVWVHILTWAAGDSRGFESTQIG